MEQQGQMEHVGVVTAVEGKTATVRFVRSKACKNCKACMMIGDTDAEVTLHNALGASVGDRVHVELEAKRFVQAYLLAYGIPLITMLLGLYAGNLFSQTMAAVLAIAGVAIGFLLLRLLEPRFASKGKFRPRMVRMELPDLHRLPEE